MTLKHSKPLLYKAIRVMIYFTISLAILFTLTNEYKRYANANEAARAQNLQLKLYLLSLQKLDPKVPEFNAQRAALMQRIYDFNQTGIKTELTDMATRVYELDSILDKIYFYDPTIDMQNQEMSVQASRAIAAADGLAGVEQRLSEILSENDVMEFRKQLAVVSGRLQAFKSMDVLDRERLIAELETEYTLLIDVAWRSELVPVRDIK